MSLDIKKSFQMLISLSQGGHTPLYINLKVIAVPVLATILHTAPLIIIIIIFFFISALQWYVFSVWQEPSGKHPWSWSSGEHEETSSHTNAVKPTSPRIPPSAVQQLWRLWWSPFRSLHFRPKKFSYKKCIYVFTSSAWFQMLWPLRY